MSKALEDTEGRCVACRHKMNVVGHMESHVSHMILVL